MTKLSKWEELFALHCHAEKLSFEREFKFHPTRKWRFDFALVPQRIGIEIEGGIWAGGRHTRGSGYEADARKYNAAAKLGWKVLRFTSGMVQSGEAIDEVLATVRAL